MSPSFAQAIARREEHGPVAVDPRDGAVLEVPDAPHELLAELLLELRRREDQMKQWRLAVEDELVRRYGERRAAQPVGNFEVEVERSMGRVWDATDLVAVAEELAERGLIRQADIAGLAHWEAKVDGRKAAALLSRVEGDALVELRRTFHWEQKGRPRVRVTPAASLEPSKEIR